ncbi:family 16 glycosylhydrolase [Novosphingobium sp. AP12]|uniref:family 16 glycosylhydrolase n=1 Tax=Novosphingobium sp. AP12 TaxID=1144305 RepID=UPI0009DAEC41|nr:family 16 glycosylhydrolase [Novosphingobium sp. AP12]
MYGDRGPTEADETSTPPVRRFGGHHRYGLLWGPQELTWFVDRQPVATAPTVAARNERDAYLIANLAVAGAWGRYADQTTKFPGKYEIRRITAWRYPSF